MGVTLPSDLVLDVMRAVDPGRLKLVVAKLSSASVAASPSQPSFSTMMDNTLRGQTGADSFPPPSSLIDSPSTEFALRPTSNQPLFGEMALVDNESQRQAAGTYKVFEQLVLRNMFESMLPRPASGAFGEESSSSGVWRSFEADQLASEYAQQGGIGLAQAIDPSASGGRVTLIDQWPYFRSSQILSFGA